MSGDGAPGLAADLDGAGLRVGVVVATWHTTIADALLAGAQRALAAVGVRSEDITIVRAPGAFELPLVAKVLAEAGNDAVVALGVVIRGGTPHFDYVCNAATDGCLRVSLDTGVPVGFGVLTCDTEEQALARSGLPGSKEDKGREAVEAALATAKVVGAIRA